MAVSRYRAIVVINCATTEFDYLLYRLNEYIS